MNYEWENEETIKSFEWKIKEKKTVVDYERKIKGKLWIIKRKWKDKYEHYEWK